MLLYAPPCLYKFPQGTPYSSMISSHVPPCLSLGKIVDAKETRDTISSNTSIFGSKNFFLTPKILWVFFIKIASKTAPIQSKIDCAKLESLLVHLTERSCS
jgi:hypothetical protein